LLLRLSSFPIRLPPSAPRFPYTPLFRSASCAPNAAARDVSNLNSPIPNPPAPTLEALPRTRAARHRARLARLREEAEPIVAEEQIGRAHRLNSSHVKISYAVFCLKKKNT